MTATRWISRVVASILIVLAVLFALSVFGMNVAR